MSLLLCRQEPVNNPYYIEVLDIHIYSSQELCYVIFNHPLLVMEEFVDNSLLDFIRRELDLPALAERMEKLMETGSRPEDALTLFLLENDYYTEKEIMQFKAAAASYRKLPAGEYEKARADYLFEKRQYGRAAARYEKVLEELKDESREEQEAFRARIYNNLGAAYAQMFRYEKAFKALDRSYGLHKDPETLKRIYFLTVFEPALAVRERYYSLFTPQARESWDQELAMARQNAMAAGEVAGLRELFKKDPVKRMKGAGELIQQWKQDYRTMS